MGKTVELNVPRTAAERIDALDGWKCCGCGMPYPDRMKRCDCATGVLFRQTGTGLVHETKIDNAPVAPDVTAALKTAIQHIEHMAAWIAKQKAGYSFESIGEDMPGLREALAKAQTER